MKEQKCETCKYFDGDCKRHVPVINQYGNGWEDKCLWPQVGINYWCGDWEEKVDE